MALWAKVSTLGGNSSEKLQSLYGDHFPIEVRRCLADWIEDKFLGDAANYLDLNNSGHEQYIKTIVMEFISVLEAKVQSFDNGEGTDSTQLIFGSAAHAFREITARDPLAVYRNVRNCLANEMLLVDQMAIKNSVATLATDNSKYIAERLEQIRKQTQITSKFLEKLDKDKGNLTCKRYERKKLGDLLIQHQNKHNKSPTIASQQEEQKILARIKLFDEELANKNRCFTEASNDLENRIAATIEKLSLLQDKVLVEELAGWKIAQLHSVFGNEVTLTKKLNSLQSYCTGLAKYIWNNRQQLKEFELIKQALSPLTQYGILSENRLTSLNAQATELLSTLVTSSFIVERQPYQVLKTKTRFPANPTVRLLVGRQLNVHMSPPKVTVSIINEAQAMALRDKEQADNQNNCGELLNNTGVMKYTKDTSTLSIHFGNMTLKNIARGDRNRAEFVTDDKFCLRFHCKFSVGEDEFICNALSNPIVVIVNVSQEAKAWATIIWDNSFSDSNRLGFKIPPQVTWFGVANALSNKFQSINGRELTDMNLQFLGEKLFSSPNFQPHSTVTWSQFCKVNLPDCSFTFWEWFYATIKLTREHLFLPWVDGRIVGFVTQEAYEKMLSTCQCGTFLIRFSDSVIGGVTVTWVQSHQLIMSVQPFTGTDLAAQSLVNRIKDIAHYAYLYPNIPKDTAFGQYLQKAAPLTRKRYQRFATITIIPEVPVPSDSLPPAVAPTAIQSLASTNSSCCFNTPGHEWTEMDIIEEHLFPMDPGPLPPHGPTSNQSTSDILDFPDYDDYSVLPRS